MVHAEVHVEAVASAGAAAMSCHGGNWRIVGGCGFKKKVEGGRVESIYRRGFLPTCSSGGRGWWCSSLQQG